MRHLFRKWSIRDFFEASTGGKMDSYETLYNVCDCECVKALCCQELQVLRDLITQGAYQSFPSYVWHDAFLCVTWLLHMCHLTPSYVWHDSCVCVTWLLLMCDRTPSYVSRDFSICVTWLLHIRVCDMTPSCVRHDSLIRVAWLLHIMTPLVMTPTYSHGRESASPCLHMCDMTPSFYEPS